MFVQNAELGLALLDPELNVLSHRSEWTALTVLMVLGRLNVYNFGGDKPMDGKLIAVNEQ